MDLSKILSIAGKSGLYKVVSQGKNAVIVESLIDNKRFPAFGHEKISSLEEISVFTNGDDMPLKDVFKTIFETLEGKPAIDQKSDSAALQKFFIGVIPDYDQERVYVSDIKKMISWYNLLLQHQLLDFTEEKSEKATEEPELTQPESDEQPSAPEEKAPVKKAPKTKPAAASKKGNKGE
jgi:hypothetical protein